MGKNSVLFYIITTYLIYEVFFMDWAQMLQILLRLRFIYDNRNKEFRISDPVIYVTKTPEIQRSSVEQEC